METEEFLSNVRIFQDLDKASLSHLASKLQIISLPEGLVVSKGDAGDALYIVKSGSASVTLSSKSDEIGVVLGDLKAGDSFGELALIDAKPRSADVTATEPVECYVLSRDDFLAVLDEHPQIAKGILPRLVAMVRSADEWIASILDRLSAHNL